MKLVTVKQLYSALSAIFLACIALYSSSGYSQSSISFDRSEYTVTEGDMIAVPLIRSGGSNGEVSVSIRIRGITATGGSDFGRAEGNLTDFNVTRRWINGEILDRTHGGYKTLNIQTFADQDYYEGTETLMLELVDISGGTLGSRTTTTIKIEDDYYSTVDPWLTTNSGSISFDQSEYWVYEGELIGIPLVRSGGSDGEVIADINIRGITATGGVDFIRAEGNPTDFRLNRRWIDGEIQDRTNGGLKTVNIQALTDSDIWEGTETLVLEIVDVTNGNAGAITTATVHIEDDYYVDQWNPGSISFERSSYTVKEGEKINVPLIRSGGSSGEVTVDITIRGVTATAGADFQRAEGDPLDFGVRRRWIDGEIQDRTTGGLKTVNIQAMADRLFNEGVESFILEIVDISGGYLGNVTQTTVSIENVSNTVSGCVYPGGNTTQWGWDNSARRACPPQSTVPTPLPTPGPVNHCVYPGGDSSKWGWDSVAGRSCAPVSTPTPITSPIQPVSNCVYPGGDTTKWGWDNSAGRSCAPVTTNTQPINPVQPVQPVANCVYPGGDTSQWGWDNVASRSCAPVANNTQPTNPAVQPVSNCVYPGGDTSKWGWDNVLQISCRPL